MKYKLELNEQELTTLKYGLMDTKDNLLKSIMKSREMYKDEKGDFISEDSHLQELVIDYFNTEAMYNKLYWAIEVDRDGEQEGQK